MALGPLHELLAESDLSEEPARWLRELPSLGLKLLRDPHTAAQRDAALASLAEGRGAQPLGELIDSALRAQLTQTVREQLPALLRQLSEGSGLQRWASEHHG